jgi:hypothetical protein
VVEVKAESGSSTVEFMALDLASLASVKAFAKVCTKLLFQSYVGYTIKCSMVLLIT